ncbi:cyclin N-terminal domain-containing protein 1-like [Oratosquilla oratoria]|uniref:cyclin N-terminal domain-containing protein 1-like n=1 Tax=Oratosquilla oratoria TaxID=337810 RepID=UPI003F7748FF
MDLGNEVFGEASSSIFSQDRKLWTKTIWEEHLKDWLGRLVEENRRLRQSSTLSLGRVLEPQMVQLVLGLTSEYNQVEPHIFYSALDLYDRFSAAHVHELAQYVLGHFKGKDLEAALRDVKRRVHQQAFLRVLSCVQLACKVNTNKRRTLRLTIKPLEGLGAARCLWD